MRESSIRIFDEHASEYDSWYVEHSAIFESEAKAIEALRPTGLGLEIGVGTGVFARRLEVTVGVDPSLGMLRLAKARGIQAVRAVGEHLPFRRVAFGFVLIAGTLCFLKEPSATIRETAEVLKDDGSLIVCEIPRDSSWGRFIDEKGRGGHRFYKYAAIYDTQDVRRILEDLGFTIVETKATLSFGPEEHERVEEASDNMTGRSYVCLRAVKHLEPVFHQTTSQ
ncbi:MAG: class I SAM-dependent methyltransferase [Candidatus Bathyarchaeia archaeon]